MGIRAVIFMAVLVLLASAGCSRPAAIPAPDGETIKKAQAIDASRFVIAGSGTNLPITAKLAAAYNKKTNVNVEIPKSIGTDGAVAAVKAGTLDLGLISRDLTAAEKAGGLKEIPYARVGIVFGVHPGVPESEVSTDDIVKIHQGLRTTWSDGSKIIVLIRGKHDSSNLVLFDKVPGFFKIIDESIEQKRWSVMYHDIDMVNTLRSKSGAFGHTDSTEIGKDSGIKALTVNGIAPSRENISSGRYPWSKNLSFVYRDLLSDRARAFVSFVESEEGQAVIISNGAVPLK